MYSGYFERPQTLTWSEYDPKALAMQTQTHVYPT